jgi:hypothetical protein
MNWLRVSILIVSGWLLATIPVASQGPICRTANIPSDAPNCASEEFVSNHFPGSSTLGDIAVFADGTGNVLQDGGPLAALLRSYLAGLTLSNDVGTPNSVLDISAGVAADSTNTVIIKLAAFTKSTAGAWTSGSGNNGMGNGLTIAPITWYHVCLANNGGTPDIWFDTSAVCANKPAGITDTKFRRIGSFFNGSLGHIIAFSQFGDEFLWLQSVGDLNAITVSTTAALETLSIPIGVKVTALFRSYASQTATQAVIFYPPDQTTQTANTPSGNDSLTWSGNSQSGGQFAVRTNTNSQIGIVATGNVYLSLATYGWIDRRGRDN